MLNFLLHLKYFASDFNSDIEKKSTAYFAVVTDIITKLF